MLALGIYFGKSEKSGRSISASYASYVPKCVCVYVCVWVEERERERERERGEREERERRERGERKGGAGVGRERGRENVRRIHTLAIKGFVRANAHVIARGMPQK